MFDLRARQQKRERERERERTERGETDEEVAEARCNWCVFFGPPEGVQGANLTSGVPLRARTCQVDG